MRTVPKTEQFYITNSVCVQLIMKAHETIGGFFGLELPYFGNFPLRDIGIPVGSGRQALELILRNIKEINVLRIPHFICPTVLEPLKRLGIKTKLYSLDDSLNPILSTPLDKYEYILYPNYFGVKSATISKLSAKFNDKLIVDNAMALFAPAIEQSHSFYSPRKFCGVPDGGIAIFSQKRVISPLTPAANAQEAHFLFTCLSEGIHAASRECEINEARLGHTPLQGMSTLTSRLLDSIDFATISKRRLENSHYLHTRLASWNRLDVQLTEAPAYYPFFTGFPYLRDKLIDHGVLLPIFWEELLDILPISSTEYKFITHILPLPIDQRLTIDQLDKILSIISSEYY